MNQIKVTSGVYENNFLCGLHEVRSFTLHFYRYIYLFVHESQAPAITSHLLESSVSLSL